MDTRSTSGFSVIPLVILLAGSGWAWLWHRALEFIQAYTG